MRTYRSPGSSPANRTTSSIPRGQPANPRVYSATREDMAWRWTRRCSTFSAANPAIWWKIVQDHKVRVMFSSPTGIRVLKKQDPAYLRKYDTSSLKHLFLAGEPLDEPTHRWISDALGKPVIDHYWQTETGWPILTAVPGVEKTPLKFGSPSFPAYGYDLKLLRETDASEAT